MKNTMRVILEMGPKGKKAAAVAIDWPGLSRGGKTGEEALETLRAYRSRYAPVAARAGMQAEYEALQDVEIVEQYTGPGSTDFWGISFGFSSIDKGEMSAEELERELALLRSCWAFFDDVRGRVSAEMQKGPRGGGRDRDKIVRHTFAAELDWASKVGIQTPLEVMLTDEGLRFHRDTYCDAMRDYHSQGILPGKVAKWPLRFLIRHTAFHTMDHAWEMEDKDLTLNNPKS